MLLVAGILAMAALPLAGPRRPWSSKRAIAVALVLLLLGGGLLFVGTRSSTWQGTREAQASMLPGRRVEGGYVTSQACRTCHEEQFESWHDSYHRTMTQAVSHETVVAPFEGVVLETAGRKYYLSRRGDEFWVNMPDPEWYLDKLSGDKQRQRGLRDEPPQVDRRVVMSTGSHHMQLYWVVNPETRRIVTLPFIYLFEDERWVPRADVFLVGKHYHNAAPSVDTWNERCVNCHAVAGQPRLAHDAGRPDTRVAELGIACEACHGPGEEHVRARTAAARQLAGEGDDVHAVGVDPTIINPARCDAKTSAQICGRCHCVSQPYDKQDWLLGAGDTFKPGTNLEDVRLLLRDPRRIALEQGTDPETAVLTNIFQSPERMKHSFWSDGQVRVSGREFNGLLESPCFQRGDMSCVSCHSLHESEPDDQLAAGMKGNQACYQCHAEYEAKLSEHTHHEAGSEGSRCYNCHMPHTTYGLMKGIRSHTISSPNVEESARFGRPNACNLCHLDQTLQWTSEQLASWYGQPQVELDEEQRQTSAALRWLLRGDAGQRAIVGWHFGWEPARQVSGTDWMPPFLAELLVDPYSAVRYIAYHALVKSDEFADLPYDYVGPPKDRAAMRRMTLERWLALPHAIPEEASSRLLMSQDGKIQEDALRKMIGRRDDRPVELWE